MWFWRKKEPHFIKERVIGYLAEKREGGAQIYIIALSILLFLAVLFRLTYDKQRVYITYDTLDDSIVAALVGSTTYNLEELAYSGNYVIFKTLTEFEPEEIPMPGETPPPEPTEDELEELEQEAMEAYLMDSRLLNPIDTYLDKARNDFVRILKRNLKLNDSYECQLSGIEGSVTIEEFAVYNRFEWYDDEGNCKGYRIIKYYHNGSTWQVYPYNMNTPVSVYSTYDHTNIPVEHTTVTAKLRFNLRLSDFNAEFYDGLTEADMLMDVSYQRAVDIKNN